MVTKKEKKRIVEQLKLDGVWDNMSPGQQRGLTILLIVLGAIILISVVSKPGAPKIKNKDTDIKRSVLTTENTRSIGVNALSARVKTNDKDLKEISLKVSRIDSVIKEMKARRGNDPAVTRSIEQLRSQVDGIRSKAKSLGWDMEDIKEGYYQVERTSDQAPSSTSSPERPAFVDISGEQVGNSWDVEDGLNEDPNYYFRTPPVRPASDTPSVGSQGLKNNSVSGAGLKIFTSLSKAVSENVKEELPVTLPSGTILSGVLLNGVDAATGRGARNDPFPVLVRIQKEAVLPNHFAAEVSECFVTLAGYGDLSSERAMLRGEMISCVTNDGDVIEAEIPAYAVGEDGKAGVRGRLVERTGSLIAKTSLAGFAAGIAEAFDTSAVPVIQTSDVSSSKTYQDSFSSEAARHGAASGASAAFERLSEYYMDMVDQIFPVVEIDAGREIDIILTSGIRMIKINNAKNSG